MEGGCGVVKAEELGAIRMEDASLSWEVGGGNDRTSEVFRSPRRGAVARDRTTHSQYRSFELSRWVVFQSLVTSEQAVLESRSYHSHPRNPGTFNIVIVVNLR